MQIQFPAEPIRPFKLYSFNQEVCPSKEDLTKIIWDIEKGLDNLCDGRLRHSTEICLLSYKVLIALNSPQSRVLFIFGGANLSEDLRDSALDHFKGTYKREFRRFLDSYKSPKPVYLSIILQGSRDMITGSVEASDLEF